MTEHENDDLRSRLRSMIAKCVDGATFSDDAQTLRAAESALAIMARNVRHETQVDIADLLLTWADECEHEVGATTRAAAALRSASRRIVGLSH